ncbi:chemotaxis protein CheY, partial [Xanthomonas vasicola pv. musacearum NCPPB 4384]
MPSLPLLCVDDESSNLATLRQLLRDDFALVFAKSGGEALDAVTRHTPKLILLDVELPDMDGYAVARALKQQPSSNAIPILFVTSRNSEHDERLGLEAGAADYVSKPYSPALLKARIATQLKLAENARLAQQYRDAIHLLGTAGQGQDADTGAHIWRMAVYARVL